MILRDYQQKAVDWLCEHERGLVVAPAGSGKTWIGSAAIARCMGTEPEHNPTVGWLCNTREQASQAGDALAKFLPLPQSCILDINCAAAGKDYSAADVLVVDEAHTCLHISQGGFREACAQLGVTCAALASAMEARGFERFQVLALTATLPPGKLEREVMTAGQVQARGGGGAGHRLAHPRDP